MVSIRDLRELTREDAARFGGKAAGLAALLTAGARVPEGFALPATRDPPAAWSDGERHALEERAGTLLGAGPVAVRSSAVGEDGAERSFAGIFETTLGVASVEAVLAAVERSVASGAAARALAYAGRNEPFHVGIVVQRMVRARAAGVCFTKDPAGRDRAIVVEAVAGLGEALVSGAMTPERWRAYRTGLATLDVRVEHPQGVLDEVTVEALVGQAAGLAEKLGAPLDLEWAIDDDGTIWWLQARPITAAPSPPAYVIERAFDGVDDGPVSVWSNWNVRETLPEPLFPLTWTYWRDEIVPMVAEQLYGLTPGSRLLQHLMGLDLVNGRLYFNMNAMLATPVIGPLMGRGLAIVDARAGATLGALVRAGIASPRRIPGSRTRVLLSMGRSSLRTAWRMRRGLHPRRALAGLERDAAVIDARGDVARLSDAELASEMRLWTFPECGRLRDGLQMETAAMAVYAAASHLFRDHPEARQRLTTGILGNPTTQISIGVDELVVEARPVAELVTGELSTPLLLERLRGCAEASAFVARLDAFLGRFGHRGPMEFDIGATRWAEDPTMILDLIRAGLSTPSRESVAQRLERLGGERRRAVEAAVAASAAWKRPLMRRFARLVELYMPLREAPKHYGVVVFRRVRQCARELGRRLASRGLLRAPDDVFFVQWPELQGIARGAAPPADLAQRIEARRQLQERFRSEKAPDFLRSDGVPVEEVLDDATPLPAGALRGTAVSAGRATGPVKLLRSPDARLVEEGDVLVMEFADPGWTPLFPRASAVVMEVGGLMCHAAIVARELGIPAVFGVHGAMRSLTDGERVTVDGGSGIVSRH